MLLTLLIDQCSVNGKGSLAASNTEFTGECHFSIPMIPHRPIEKPPFVSLVGIALLNADIRHDKSPLEVEEK